MRFSSGPANRLYASISSAGSCSDTVHAEVSMPCHSVGSTSAMRLTLPVIECTA